MNSRSTGIALAVLALCAVGALGYAQGRPHAKRPNGPYRVFMSKEIVTPGQRPDEISREHEYLTNVLNDLDAQGYMPVMMDVLTQGDGDDTPGTEHRMVLICVPK